MQIWAIPPNPHNNDPRTPTMHNVHVATHTLWRLIRRALATGARASKFSKHIAKECSRCGMLETDSHLFFHCTFAKVVWFSTTLGLRTDAYDTTLYPSNIVHAMLQIHQPENSVDKIFTLLWCIWKARNDFLFNRSDELKENVVRVWKEKKKW